jgi:hypothetical protein
MRKPPVPLKFNITMKNYEAYWPISPLFSIPRIEQMPHFSYFVKHLKNAHIAYREQPRLNFSKARVVSSEGEPRKGSSGGAHRTHPALGMAQPVQGSSVYRDSGRFLSPACLTS